MEDIKSLLDELFEIKNTLMQKALKKDASIIMDVFKLEEVLFELKYEFK